MKEKVDFGLPKVKQGDDSVKTGGSIDPNSFKGTVSFLTHLN